MSPAPLILPSALSSLKYLPGNLVVVSETPRASVIIPSLGRADRLMECIGSVLAQEVPFRVQIVMVIDGSGSKALASQVKARFPSAHILADCSDSRRGSPGAKNAGVAISSGEVLVFIDDDTVAQNGWLGGIVAAYSEGVGGVGGAEEKVRTQGVLRRAWYQLSGNSTGRVTRGGIVVSNFTPSKKKTESVQCLAGANMSFLRRAFVEAGGFDVNYIGNAYREETDLCLRIGKSRRLIFVPDAVVRHLEDEKGGNTAEDLRAWNYWYHRNNTYFFLKNVDDGTRFTRIRHQLGELALAFGRMINQRSLTPFSTAGVGARDGRKAFDAAKLVPS